MASLLAVGRASVGHMWHGYCDHLVKRPLLTKILTGARKPRNAHVADARARIAIARCCCALVGARSADSPFPAPHPAGVAGTVVGDGIAQV